MHFAVLIAVVGIATAAVLQHSLTRRKSRKIQMIERGEYPAYVKYRNALRSSKVASSEQQLADFESFEYVGKITVGTPDQQFTVALDTGSANFWVPDAGCNDSCDGRQRFSSSSSSTFVKSNKTWLIQYGVGQARGYYGTDTFKFGGMYDQQLAVPNTTFGLATRLTHSSKFDPQDGILGLAYTSLAVDHVVPPLINAIHQSEIDNWFHCTRDSKDDLGDQYTAVDRETGLFTYGAIDTDNCGPVIAYQSLSSATYYQFKMSAVGLGSYRKSKVYEVISDTGSSNIEGPKAIIDQIAKAAGAEYSESLDSYIIPCDLTLPTLDITIETKTYSISPYNYIVVVVADLCSFAVMPLEFGGFGPAWALGAPFIRQYCNIYDIGQKRIGFANSIQSI